VVREKAREVVHRVRFGSTPAGYEHMDLVRKYRLRGDRLVLSVAVTAELTLHLYWVRGTNGG
jgi:hypothetical protein